jgi:hypothetical protein
MKGSMRQRGSAWELRVYLGVDPVSSKQRARRFGHSLVVGRPPVRVR